MTPFIIKSSFDCECHGLALRVEFIADSKRYDVYSTNDCIGTIYYNEKDDNYKACTPSHHELFTLFTLEGALCFHANRYIRKIAAMK